MTGLKVKTNRGVVFFFLVAVCAYMPSARFTDGIVSLAALLLLLFNTVYMLFKKKCRIKIDGNLKWYLLFVLYGCMSILWSKDTTQIWLYLKTSFPVIMAGVLCCSAYINDEEDVDMFLKELVWAGTFAAIRFTLYTPWKSILSSGYFIRGMFASLLDDVTNYNNYSTHLMYISIVALYYTFLKKERKYFVPFSILLIVQALSGSRKNMVVIPIVALFMSLTQGDIKKKAKSLLAIVLCGFAAVYAFNHIAFLEKYQKVFLDLFSSISGNNIVDTSTMQRTYLIQTAVSVWIENPIIGVGWENFALYNDLNLLAHNNYLELLASLGLIGFAVYYSNYIRLFWGSIRKNYRKPINRLMQSLIISLLIVEIGSVTANSRERMFIILMVFLCHTIQEKRKVTYIKAGNM